MTSASLCSHIGQLSNRRSYAAGSNPGPVMSSRSDADRARVRTATRRAEKQKLKRRRCFCCRGRAASRFWAPMQRRLSLRGMAPPRGHRRDQPCSGSERRRAETMRHGGRNGVSRPHPSLFCADREVGDLCPRPRFASPWRWAPSPAFSFSGAPSGFFTFLSAWSVLRFCTAGAARWLRWPLVVSRGRFGRRARLPHSSLFPYPPSG